MGVISKPNTFSPNTTMSSSQVNSNFDTIYNEFNGNIAAANLATGAVTTAKIADSNVTTAKIADSNVTTAKIADGAVTFGKLDSTVSWWQELGRTTLGSAGDTITVSSLPARKYLKVIVSLIPSSSIDGVMRFNNDTGSNYAYNRITSGTSASNTSATSISMNPDSIAQQKWAVADIVNIASQEKSVLTKSMSIGAAGAGTAPAARDTYGKWVNTSSQITQIDIVNLAAGDFAIGSEVVVLGHN